MKFSIASGRYILQHCNIPHDCYRNSEKFRSHLSESINKTATCSGLFGKCACAYHFEKKCWERNPKCWKVCTCLVILNGSFKLVLNICNVRLKWFGHLHCTICTLVYHTQIGTFDDDIKPPGSALSEEWQWSSPQLGEGRNGPIAWKEKPNTKSDFILLLTQFWI